MTHVDIVRPDHRAGVGLHDAKQPADAGRLSRDHSGVDPDIVRDVSEHEIPALRDEVRRPLKTRQPHCGM